MEPELNFSGAINRGHRSLNSFHSSLCLVAVDQVDGPLAPENFFENIQSNFPILKSLMSTKYRLRQGELARPQNILRNRLIALSGIQNYHHFSLFVLPLVHMDIHVHARKCNDERAIALRVANGFFDIR